MLGGAIGVGVLMLVLNNPDATVLPRVANLVMWWLLLGWLVACWAALPEMGEVLVPVPGSVRGLIAALLFLGVGYTTVRAVADLYYAPEWAQQRAARNQVLLAAQQQRKRFLVVAPIKRIPPHYVLIRGYDILPYCQDPLNRATAAYFGLDSVRTDDKQMTEAYF